MRAVAMLLVALAVLDAAAVPSRAARRLEVGIDGLPGVVGIASDGTGHGLWLARAAPSAVGHFDGRAIRWTPLDDGGVPQIATAPGGVVYASGHAAGRIDLQTGAVTPLVVGAVGNLSAPTVAPDGSTWLQDGDSAVHHVVGGTDRVFGSLLAFDEGSASAVAGDGRLWFAWRYGAVAVLDGDGHLRLLELPRASTVESLLPDGGDRMLVATSLGHLRLYDATRLVRDVREPQVFGSLARDAAGRLWASGRPVRKGADVGLTRLDARLRATATVPPPVAFRSLDARGRPSLQAGPPQTGGLVRGPGDDLWTASSDALLRLTTGTPAARAGCALPGTARVLARGTGSELVALRGLQDPGQFLACADGASAPVALQYSSAPEDPDDGDADALGHFQIVAGLAVAARAQEFGHYGAFTDTLESFDLATGRVVATTVIAQAEDGDFHAPPELDDAVADRAGRFLFTQTTTAVDGGRTQTLVLAGHGVIASGPAGSITDLALTSTAATWSQDGQPHSAGLSRGARRAVDRSATGHAGPSRQARRSGSGHAARIDGVGGFGALATAVRVDDAAAVTPAAGAAAASRSPRASPG